MVRKITIEVSDSLARHLSVLAELLLKNESLSLHEVDACGSRPGAALWFLAVCRTLAEIDRQGGLPVAAADEDCGQESARPENVSR